MWFGVRCALLSKGKLKHMLCIPLVKCKQEQPFPSAVWKQASRAHNPSLQESHFIELFFKK